MRAAALTLTSIFPKTCPQPQHGRLPGDLVPGEVPFTDLVFRGLPEVMKKPVSILFSSTTFYFYFSIDPRIQWLKPCTSGSMSCRDGFATQPVSPHPTDSALGSVPFRLTKSLIPCVLEQEFKYLLTLCLFFPTSLIAFFLTAYLQCAASRRNNLSIFTISFFLVRDARTLPDSKILLLGWTEIQTMFQATYYWSRITSQFFACILISLTFVCLYVAITILQSWLHSCSLQWC